MVTKTIDRVSLICTDDLPMALITTSGENFELRWREKIRGEWVTYFRRMGRGARELVGLAGSDPRILKHIIGKPEHTVIWENSL